MRRVLGRWVPMAVAMLAGAATSKAGGDADIILPRLGDVTFVGGVTGVHLMCAGLVVCLVGLCFGYVQYKQTAALPVHDSMRNVSDIIWETCKTYLFQQGKFLAALWLLIGACITYYFLALQHKSASSVGVILLCSILGILGSYAVAWFGIRINTRANSRSAFASLRGRPWLPLNIPIKSG